MDDVRNLVQKITKDRDAMSILFEALLDDTNFVRALTEKISEAVEDGVILKATECRR